MLPEAIIDCRLAGQPEVAFVVVLERHRVGLLAAEGLDDSLRLAVRSRREKPSANVSEP